MTSPTDKLRECTAWDKHADWCDCGRPTCWEEQLRLRVQFDKNPDREACVLFIHRMMQTALQAERDSWINQPANEHDERIRRAERTRLEGLLPREVDTENIPTEDEFLADIQSTKGEAFWQGWNCALREVRELLGEKI